MGPHTLSVCMKRCLQLVAFCLVALLAVPPALADELCRVAQGWQKMSEMACCADSAGGSRGNASDAGAIAPIAQTQSCTEGCCSVSPQSTPQPGAPEKATTVLVPLAPCGNTIAAFVPVVLLGGNCRIDATPPDRQVLLQVFRI